MHPWLLPALISPIAAVPPNSKDMLSLLERRAKALEGPWTNERERAKRHLAVDLLHLLRSNQLRTGEALRRAGQLTPTFWQDFAGFRQKYELALAAAALGDEPAAGEIRSAWDQLLMAMGRRPHTDSQVVPRSGGEAFVPQLTVKAVLDVFHDPIAARRAAMGLPSHVAFKALAEADQAQRIPPSHAGGGARDFAAEAKADAARRETLQQLLTQVDRLNAQDFMNASLVMQHGQWFEDYALAHELAVCAMLLDPKALGMVAVTYDRMLQSAGYRQRVGTQYGALGELRPVEADGFTDVMRRALGRQPLAAIPRTLH